MGILITVVILVIGFYVFLFLNPLQIYEENLLKWIPLFLGIMGMFFSGIINRKTPIKFLPFLFLPYIIFDLFSFFYLPFIFVLLIVGVGALLVVRTGIRVLHRILSGIVVLAILLYFMFSQPLIVLKENSQMDDQGRLVNSVTIWNFEEDKILRIPNHIVYDLNDTEFNLKSNIGKTYLITFWATWCPPCMEEKPRLENFKKEFIQNPEIKFIDISLDKDVDKWKHFIQEKEPLGMQLISKNQKETKRLLQIGAIPIHFIVDANGEYKKYYSLNTTLMALRKQYK